MLKALYKHSWIDPCLFICRRFKNKHLLCRIYVSILTCSRIHMLRKEYAGSDISSYDYLSICSYIAMQILKYDLASICSFLSMWLYLYQHPSRLIISTYDSISICSDRHMYMCSHSNMYMYCAAGQIHIYTYFLPLNDFYINKGLLRLIA